MGLYTEFVAGSEGVRGEVAPLRHAHEVAWWRSWKNAAAMIGPVAVAYEGLAPDFDNKIEFKSPTLIIFDRIRQQRGVIDEVMKKGLTISLPLVFDEEEKCFSELMREGEETPVSYLWIDYENADCIRSYTGSIPYVNHVGNRLEIPAHELAVSL